MSRGVRIIAGQWRGRRVPVPALAGLRPSGDRVRETVFNWLTPQLAGAQCLDLFAGTGILGLEAASRGAGRVVLVERDRRLVEALYQIREDWPGATALEPVCADVYDWLARATGPYDLVFADPPFDEDHATRLMAALGRPGLLAKNACLYLEQPAPVAGHRSGPAPGPALDRPPPVASSGPSWTLVREKRFGRVCAQLLRPAPL